MYKNNFGKIRQHIYLQVLTADKRNNNIHSRYTGIIMEQWFRC